MKINKLNHEKESGQGLLEYGMIIVLAAIIVIIVVSFLGFSVQGLYCQIVTEFTGNIPEECLLIEAKAKNYEELDLSGLLITT